MGRPQTIDHDKIKRAILEFLSPEKTTGMFLGFPTLSVYNFIVKFWRVHCSKTMVFDNLQELYEKGLVARKETKLGHFYWRSVSSPFLKGNTRYEVETLRRAHKSKQKGIKKKFRVPFNEEEAWKKAQANRETRKRELERLGFDLTHILDSLQDPFPQFEVDWIKDVSPDAILKGQEQAYREITPPSKKKQRLLKELEWIKKGFIVEGGEQVFKDWGKATPFMKEIFEKLLKEIGEEEKAS